MRNDRDQVNILRTSDRVSAFWIFSGLLLRYGASDIALSGAKDFDSFLLKVFTNAEKYVIL